MKRMISFSRVSAGVLFWVLVFFLQSSNAVIISRPLVTCAPLPGDPPAIDGTFQGSQWPSSPQLTISSPIQSDIYCMNDSTNLYFLVDAVGDKTGNDTCDECLLWFGFFPQNIRAEIWTGTSSGSDLPTGSSAAVGFDTSPNDAINKHRIYEFKIPLSSINASAGETIDFSSPAVGKACFGGSMPYDSGTGGDNVWPSNLDTTDMNTYGQLKLDPAVQGIPTLDEWGMIIFMVLAGMGSIFFLRRKQKPI